MKNNWFDLDHLQKYNLIVKKKFNFKGVFSSVLYRGLFF